VTSVFISPRIHSNLGNKPIKRSATLLPIYLRRTVYQQALTTLSDITKDPAGPESLLKRKQVLQVTRDPACKTAVHWVAKIIEERPVERHSNGGKQK
jgi:hypothetical protein